MSTLLYIGIVLAAIIGLGAGFKLGNQRAHKNRAPRDEDPRDQAIRELRSEINIAKRSVEVAKTTESKAVEELAEVKGEISKLTASLNDVEQKYVMTKDILKKESEEKEKLTEINSSQRIETDTLRSQVHELEMQVNMTTAPDMLVSGQSEALEAAEAQIGALKEEIGVLRAAESGGEHGALLKKAAAQNSALKTKVQALEADLATAEQMTMNNPETTRLENEVRKLELQLGAAADAKTQLESARAEITASQKELHTLREELVSAKASAGRVPDLEQEIAEWRDKSGRLSEIEKEFRSLESANAELSNKLEGAEAAIERNSTLQQQLNEAELEKQALRREVSEMQADIDEGQKLKARVSQLETATHQLEQEKQSLGKDVHRLQIVAKAAEKLKAELERLRSFAVESEKSRKELSRLYQQHRVEKDEHAKLEATLREKMDADRSQIDRLETQAAETDAKLQAAIHEKEQQDRELQELKQSDRELTELSQTYKARIDELESEQNQSTERFNEKLNEISAQLADKESLRQQLETELTAAQSEITALKLDTEQTAIQAEELAELRADLDQAKADQAELSCVQDLLKETREQLESKASEMLQLQEQLDTAMADAENAQSAATRLQTQIDEWQAERDELHSQTQQIQDTAATSMRISNEMVDRLQKSSAECDNLRQQNAELERTAQASIDECENLRYQILELEESANAVHNERAEVVDRLRNAIADNEMLKHQLQEIAVLQANNQQLRATLSSMNSTMLDMQSAGINPDAESALEKTTTFVHDGVSVPASAATDTAQDDETGALPVINSGHDDLRSIKGVGEVLEGKLKKLGIVSYRDIMELGPEDFERAAELIPNLESRWQRDDWRQQAEALLSQKHDA